MSRRFRRLEPRRVSPRRMWSRAAALAFLPLLILGGCAGEGGRISTVSLAMDGPALQVVASYGETGFHGEMDRTVMAGVGLLKLTGDAPDENLTCRAELNAEPTEKGRVRGFLECSDKTVYALSLRNIGPDQGVGVARPQTGEGLMILFYHSSADEAKRRFPQVLADMEEARSKAGG